jgi:hypothetical protein
MTIPGGGSSNTDEEEEELTITSGASGAKTLAEIIKRFVTNDFIKKVITEAGGKIDKQILTKLNTKQQEIMFAACVHQVLYGPFGVGGLNQNFQKIKDQSSIMGARNMSWLLLFQL